MLSLLSFSTLALSLASLPSTSAYINYTTVTGIFLQDDPSTKSSIFNFATTNFGLINQTYSNDHSNWHHGKPLSQWQRLAHYITYLQRSSPSNVDYKLLFMGRHGEGYHNAAESYFGTPAWNCYWSEIYGNATVNWTDAHLTPNGIKQAQVVNNLWATEIKEQQIPLPQRYYTSPLSRCLSTAQISFQGLPLPKNHPFIPEVKELFREGISGHTCDHRSSKTYIHENFPTYIFEEGFSEIDMLWEALHGETTVDQRLRSKIVLDEVFNTDTSTYISITSHSGEIGAILFVLGHRTFSLSTGAVIPVLVKAETIAEPAPTTASQAYTALATCSTPPTITAPTCNDCSCCTATPNSFRY